MLVVNIIKKKQDILIFGNNDGGKKQRHTTAFNDNLHKIYIALIFLCDEMKELKDIAEAKFYQPLIMFGNIPSEILTSASLTTSDNAAVINEAGGVFPSGEKERMLGQMMPLLQELSNFIDRLLLLLYFIALYSFCLS